MDYKAIAGALFAEVEKYVGTRITEISSAMEALQSQIKELSEREPIAGPPGKDGTNGIDGKDGADGKEGAPGLAGQKGADGEAGPEGKPGADGAAGIDGAKGEDGRDGREGDPGRDAVHIDVIDGIDPAKKYQRGTFAAFRGGMVRSFRATDQMPIDGDLERHGWHVVVRGICGHEIEASEDLRTFTVRSVMTDGVKTMATVRSPAMMDRGIWREENKYLRGDGVTCGGSFWVAQVDSPPGKPGDPDSGWRLVVRKGRDAK